MPAPNPPDPRAPRKGEVKYHVRNLSYDTTDHDLREFFARFGEVVEAHIFTNPVSGESRGFAILRIIDCDALRLDGVTFQGRQMRVKLWGV